jgi:hypothetical protein
MGMELAVERIAALFYLIMGVSLLFRPFIWVNYIDELRKENPAANAYALVHLLLGLIIVVFHNTWSMEASVIITIVGWGVILKMVTFLLFPRFLVGLLPTGDKLTKMARLEGAIFTFFMLWVLWRNCQIVSALS